MISKTASHALKALVALGERPDEFQGAASIAARIGAPQNYLGKLLQTLAQSGLVYSQKGKGGGFQLARKLEAITLFDIVEPIDHVSKRVVSWAGPPVRETTPARSMRSGVAFGISTSQR